MTGTLVLKPVCFHSDPIETEEFRIVPFPWWYYNGFVQEIIDRSNQLSMINGIECKLVEILIKLSYRKGSMWKKNGTLLDMRVEMLRPTSW